MCGGLILSIGRGKRPSYLSMLHEVEKRRYIAPANPVGLWSSGVLKLHSIMDRELPSRNGGMSMLRAYTVHQSDLLLALL